MLPRVALSRCNTRVGQKVARRCLSASPVIAAESFVERQVVGDGSHRYQSTTPTKFPPDQQGSEQQRFPATRSKPATAEDIAYRAGLRQTQFTSECVISDETPTIPIFRVMNVDGSLDKNWDVPWEAEECVGLYKFMLRLSVWDSLLYNIQRQGRISFYIQNQGEEALQTGLGLALKDGDNLWCQYREFGVLLQRGFTLQDALAQCFSTKDDPGKGRQMPISYTKREIGLQTICTPLGTQLPHAAGCGYALKLDGADAVSVAVFGEGAASEGDFHAALNFAAVLGSQTMFVCRNNGYAISTPVEDQYVGDGIAIRGMALGIPSIRVDGNDLIASHIAARNARALCVEQKKPVLIEYMTYRMGHHSTSDDSSQYRPRGEFAAWQEIGVNAIPRFRAFLEKHKLWNDEEEEIVRKSAKDYMLAELKKIEAVKTVPVIEGIFEDVYDEMPWHLKLQAAELRDFLEENGAKYNLARHEGL